MGNKRRHGGLRLKAAIAISLVFMWLVVALFYYINEPAVQARVIAAVNKVSSLKIASGKFEIHFLKRRASVTNLTLVNPKKRQKISVESASFRFRILPLFRAAAKLKDLSVKGVMIELEGGALGWKKPGSRLGLKKLLLLRNLSIQNGKVEDITFRSLKNSSSVKKIGIEYEPKFTGDIDLELLIDSPSFTTMSGRTLSASQLTVTGTSDVSEWRDEFPYIDDLKGRIEGENIDLAKTKLDSFKTSLSYSGGKLKLDELLAKVEGHAISVRGEVNRKGEKYLLDVAIPEPVFLPAFGGENAFFNTAGNITAKIHAEGKGFDYRKTEAIADVSATHTLLSTPPLPVDVSAAVKVSGGVISASNALLTSLGHRVTAGGSFNYLHPDMQLSFRGEGIPVEAVLSRFVNRHFHPTKGVADVTGTFSGWKPDYKLSMKVEASPASYYDMAAERAEMELEVTYQHVLLNGRIFQGGRETGTVDLKVSLGEMLANKTRRKSFDINVKLAGHDLKHTMAAYGLSGIGSGAVHLAGSPAAFTGDGTGQIENGSFKGIDFQTVASGVKFSPMRVAFGEIKIVTAGAGSESLPNPVFLDTESYGVHLYGSPRPNISFDAKYMSAQKLWRIENASYTSPGNPDSPAKLSGTVSSGGILNLRANGTLDGAIFSNLHGLTREVSGPLTLRNIAITGTGENPAVDGTIIFGENTLQLRNFGYYIDNISGSVELSGHTINIPDLTGRIEYGTFKLGGRVTHQNKEISSVDIGFSGHSIMYSILDRALRMELDCDLTLKGSRAAAELKGDANILDGRYTKKFSIFEKMKESGREEEEAAETGSLFRNMALDLKVRSTGDLVIDNNIGKVWLNVKMDVKGTTEWPKFAGSVETVGGKIQYAGIDFEVMNGFVELSGSGGNPYVEFTASKEVGNYNIILTVRGPTDRLLLDLKSTPPLEKKDIFAMLTYGIREEDVKKAQFGYHLGAGIVAEQVTSMISSPIKRFTPLDQFRIETSPQGGKQGTRLFFGKDISDRLKVSLVTDINTSVAQQMFQAEYLLTDFLLLKGAGSSNSEYRFHLTFRFREQ